MAKKKAAKSKEAKPAGGGGAISASMVKELREKTGAPMMTCKQILTEVDGDFEKAITELRKRDAKLAEKKAGREAKEGLVASYIHMDKIGVLVEVNSETDFVAKNDLFKDFVKDLTLHIAAAAPQYLTRDEVPEDIVDKEREIFAEQMKDKPPQAMEKIMEGKLNKFFSTICLMEQGYIQDPDKTIDQLLKAKIGEIGENLVIRRFTRFALGEDA
ncbi:MAG: translation elongation factor Ts [Verrucomicrobiota bacterium]